MFRSDNYEEDMVVTWVDHEGVYEGTIDTLYNSFAKMRNVKKLMPVDHTVRVPYWKISEIQESIVPTKFKDISVDEDLNSKGERIMSTKANIILRSELNIRREIYLYQHADAHPNNLTLILAEMLRDTYIEFKELGDVDWFLNPSKLASFLLVRSVPSVSEEIKELLSRLPDSARYQLESSYFLGMPKFLIENSRVSNCNYEYIITLSENVEEGFYGYELEVNKMHANKVVSTVMKHKENLSREKINK